jgi:hypothetical protein
MFYAAAVFLNFLVIGFGLWFAFRTLPVLTRGHLVAAFALMIVALVPIVNMLELVVLSCGLIGTIITHYENDLEEWFNLPVNDRRSSAEDE